MRGDQAQTSEVSQTSEVYNGFKETEIGPIPVDWDVIPLGKLARVKYGKARPKQEGAIPAVGSGGIYAWVNEALVDYPTLIIGRKGTAGRAWLMEEPCWPSDTTFYLEWTKDVDIRFVFGYLTLSPLSGEHAKTTLPSLSRPDLENYLIPLPSLPEQRRIAHVLGTIQRTVAAQDGLITAAREVKRSLMQRLFTYGPGLEPAPTKETEIGEVPEHWGIGILNELCEKIVDCPHTTPKYRPSGVLVVRNFNIRDGHLRLDRAFFTSEEEYRERVARAVPQAGDVLFSREAPIGEACLIPAKTRLSLGQRTMLLRVDSAKLSNAFLVYTFYSENIRRIMMSMGTGVTAKHLNVGDVRRLMVPLPPVEEQDEIAHCLATADRKIAVEQDRKAALQALFKSMLHQLMTGQLRPAETSEVWKTSEV